MAKPQYHYGRAIRRSTKQLLDLFNEYEIKRYDPETMIASATLPVRLRFGPKEKIYEELLLDVKQQPYYEANPALPNITLPGMVLTFNSLSFDSNRMRPTLPFLPTYYISGSSPTGEWVKSYLSIPANMNFSLVGASKYYDEILQLYEQVWETFYPMAWIDMPVDELGVGTFTKWPITLNTTNGPDSNTKHENSFFDFTFSFGVKGFIYKETQSGATQIHEVCARFWNYEIQVDDSLTVDGDDIDISAVPSAISSMSADGGYTSAIGIPSVGQQPLTGADYQYTIESRIITGI